MQDLILLLGGDFRGRGHALESLQSCEFPSEDGFVEVERFLGLAVEVEIRVDRFHGKKCGSKLYLRLESIDELCPYPGSSGTFDDAFLSGIISVLGGCEKDSSLLETF